VARASAAIVHKVLNNNVVISIDPSGQERVLMGRGLGFQLIEAVTSAVDEAERSLGRSLGRRLPLAIIDHI